MLSIFAADLTRSVESGDNPCGASNGLAGTAMMRAIADHYDLPFSSVHWVLRDLFPQSREHLSTVAGWRLFGDHIAQMVATEITTPFQPMVH